MFVRMIDAVLFHDPILLSLFSSSQIILENPNIIPIFPSTNISSVVALLVSSDSIVHSSVRIGEYMSDSVWFDGVDVDCLYDRYLGRYSFCDFDSSAILLTQSSNRKSHITSLAFCVYLGHRPRFDTNTSLIMPFLCNRSSSSQVFGISRMSHLL